MVSGLRTTEAHTTGGMQYLALLFRYEVYGLLFVLVI